MEDSYCLILWLARFTWHSLQVSSMLLYMSEFPSFLRLDETPLYVCLRVRIIYDGCPVSRVKDTVHWSRRAEYQEVIPTQFGAGGRRWRGAGVMRGPEPCWIDPKPWQILWGPWEDKEALLLVLCAWWSWLVVVLFCFWEVQAMAGLISSHVRHSWFSVVLLCCWNTHCILHHDPEH